jgi:ABC-type branched-subunit amino acid transport system permease subunit
VTPRTGLLLLRAGLVAIGAFLVGAGGWIALQSVRNPDVRMKRPRSLGADVAFDHAFWSPLLWTVVVGALAVAAVLWAAYRRLRRGEDLFAQRHGRGLRRRGERAFPSDLS